jgi:hypothetical protein
MSHIQVAPPLKSEQFLTEGDSESLTAMSTEHCWRSGLFPNRSGDSWFPLRVASSLGRKRGWVGVGGDPPAQNGGGRGGTAAVLSFVAVSRHKSASNMPKWVRRAAKVLTSDCLRGCLPIDNLLRRYDPRRRTATDMVARCLARRCRIRSAVSVAWNHPHRQSPFSHCFQVTLPVS